MQITLKDFLILKLDFDIAMIHNFCQWLQPEQLMMMMTTTMMIMIRVL